MSPSDRGFKLNGFEVSISKLCRGFGFTRRNVYHKVGRATPKGDPSFSEPIRTLIEEEPSFGNETVVNPAGLQQECGPTDLPAQGLAGQKAAHRSRIDAVLPVAIASDQHWVNDLCRVWGGRDDWLTLAFVIDRYTRELQDCRFYTSGEALAAGVALEQDLQRFPAVLNRDSHTHLFQQK